MSVLLDTRPPGIPLFYLPGDPLTIVVNWPAGSLVGRTFTSTLGAAVLGVSIVGDVMAITATPAQTAAGAKTATWKLVDTTAADDVTVIMGRWAGVEAAGGTQGNTVTVMTGSGAVQVAVQGMSSVGDLTVAGDLVIGDNLTLPLATLPGDGTVDGGVIRQVHSIQVPWNYTQTATSISDPALGTALHVPIDVVVDNDPPGISGPQFQSGHFGPRGIVNLEGPVRYARDMGPFGFAPVGYGDFITITNEPSGTPRVLAPSWTFLSGRSVIAHGAACALSGTDVGPSGADFVSSSVWGSMNGGHLDGSAGSIEHVDFQALFGVVGHVTLHRRVAYDVKSITTGFPAPGNPHWDLPGSVDALNLTLDEHIGLRVPLLAHGTKKLGVQTAHPIEVLHEDFTSTSDQPAEALTFPSTTKIILNNAGFGFGNEFDGINFRGTLEFEKVSPFGSGHVLINGLVVKNPSGGARTLLPINTVASGPTYQGDGAALTVNEHRGLADIPSYSVINAGTVSGVSSAAVLAGVTVGAGATVQTRRGLQMVDGTGAGVVQTQVGVDIPVLAKGTVANIGVRNASTEVLTPTVVNIGAAGDTIPATARVVQLNNTTGAGITLTSTPTIADGQPGQVLEAICTSAQPVTLTRGAANNLRLGAATRALTTGDSIRLMFSATLGDWVELSYSGDITT